MVKVGIEWGDVVGFPIVFDIYLPGVPRVGDSIFVARGYDEYEVAHVTWDAVNSEVTIRLKEKK